MYTEQQGSTPERFDPSKRYKKELPSKEIGKQPSRVNTRIGTPEEATHKQALADVSLEASRRTVETTKKTGDTPAPFETRFEKILQNIERQLAQQREEIVRLKSVYDKAWFGRGKKLQELEAVKTKRTE